MLLRLQFPFRLKMLEVEVRKDLEPGSEIDLVYQNGKMSFSGRFHICSDRVAWYRSPIPSNVSFAELLYSVKEVPVEASPTPESL